MVAYPRGLSGSEITRTAEDGISVFSNVQVLLIIGSDLTNASE